MNNGILTSGYQPPDIPKPLLGSPSAIPLPDADVFDADAARYLRAVEVADGQPLERGVRSAVNAFVIGCKTDGIWHAIEASCILCGARTLAGALTPLRGPVPTNNNFVSADYSRRNGLTGNGTNKRLRLGRNNNDTPTNSTHFSIFFTSQPGSGFLRLFGTGTTVDTIAGYFSGTSFQFCSLRGGTGFTAGTASVPASLFKTLFCMTRNDQSSCSALSRNARQLVPHSAVTPSVPVQISLFESDGYGGVFSLGFYSHGRHIETSALSRRVTTLYEAMQSGIV